jgi:pyridoxamine 5'-phosphate oxidase
MPMRPAARPCEAGLPAPAQKACSMTEGEERTLDEEDLASDWLTQFESWRAEVDEALFAEPDAMVLATATPDGQPSARTVLLKGIDERGFEFFTNLDSRKGQELAANPRASLLFPWYALRRQVIAIGSVVTLGGERADEYFASRAYRSRLGALASRQSSVIDGREVLERALADAERRYPPDGPVPRPERWGGFRVVPASVEFWQGRRDRLHDRLRYRREGAGDWVVERLSP